MSEYLILNNNGDRVYLERIKADKIITDEISTKLFFNSELVAVVPLTLSVIKL
jgi:hypothetical protein